MALTLWNDPFYPRYIDPFAPLVPTTGATDLWPYYYRDPFTNLEHQLKHLDIGGRKVNFEDDPFSGDHFRANLDVQHFKPEEVSVTVSENTIIVTGKHEDSPDEHGSIARHFVRKYMLPPDYDINKVEATLSSDGVLTITAPKTEGTSTVSERKIPIKFTGKLSKAISHLTEAARQAASKISPF